IFDRIGRIPDVGDELWIEGVKFTVLEIENQRLAKLRVEREPEGPSAPSALDTEASEMPTPSSAT
ncbi:MAG: transporter associated domain-containing protein, partial [Thermomicrobiales bacterium]